MINRPLYINELRKWINKPLIKVLTGIRRSGKSTVLKLLREEFIHRGIASEQIETLSFESFATEHLKNAPALYEYLKTGIRPSTRRYLLLDEIQEVDGWEKVVNSMVADFDVDIYITGSNSHLLSSELATYLAGRYIEIPVFPLSFREFMEFRKFRLPGSDEPESSFIQYLRKGGFPVIHLQEYDDDSAYKIVRDIYSSVIFRDTIRRYKIRDTELLERVIRFVFDNVGNTFSGKKIADYFKSQQRKTDINTIYNYLHALEGAFILYRVSRFDIRGKERLKTQEKFFVSDPTLVYAQLGYRDRQISGMLENVVFLELKRRGYQVYVGKLDTVEIDFIAERAGGKLYIQVAYKLESESTVEREFNALLAVRDQYPKYVVTMDELWKDNIEGVRHMHIRDFLLSDDY